MLAAERAGGGSSGESHATWKACWVGAGAIGNGNAMQSAGGASGAEGMGLAARMRWWELAGWLG